MKQGLLYTLGPIVLIMVAFANSPAQVQPVQQVQTVAPVTLWTGAVGPYYAIPSWDQQLPASTRFIVLSNWGNAAVLDKETGLVWERTPSKTTANWGFALNSCTNLNLGNRKGWRLPTIQELSSLVDMSVPSSPKLPSGHPFMNVQSSRYWSASIYYPNSPHVFVLELNNGWVSNAEWGGSASPLPNLYYWCVRGGQGVGSD